MFLVRSAVEAGHVVGVDVRPDLDVSSRGSYNFAELDYVFASRYLGDCELVSRDYTFSEFHHEL